jgi:tetratricopeptide (TPR) repeat protein
MYDRLPPPRTRGAIGLFVVAATLYIWGLSPTIAWRDASEFTTIAHTLDISHPAGSPTYSLLAKITALFPIGSIAQRVNFFSALVAAGTVSLLYALLYDLLFTSTRWIRWSAALSGSLFLLFCLSFWRFAETAEVYTLQNFFLILLLRLLLKGATSSHLTQAHYFWLFAFCYGLSAGVHATMALFMPGFLSFIILAAPQMFCGRRFAFLAFFFLLGFSVYLYLPLRSLTLLAFDWGDPQTWQQFLAHLTDRKHAADHTVFIWKQLPHQVRLYGQHLMNEFTLFGCMLGLLGFVCLAWKDFRLCLLLSLIFLGNVGFFIRTWTVAWGFIPSYVIFTIWIGVGLQQLLEAVSTIYRRYPIRLPRIVVYASVCAAVMISLGDVFARHFPVARQTDNYSAEIYGKHLLDQLPPGALLFSEYAWFPLLYFQQVEHRRPDLTLMLQGEVFFPQYFPIASKQRFPNLHHLTSDEPVKMSTFKYFLHLTHLNEADHPLFWEPVAQHQTGLADHLIPQGFLFSFHPSTNVNVTADHLVDHWKTTSRIMQQVLRDVPDEEAISLLTHKLNFIANFFRDAGMDAEAEKTYRIALGIWPRSQTARHNYGVFLMDNGQLQTAFEQIYQAYTLDPIDPIFNKNLGTILLRIHAVSQAVHFLERALDFGSTDADVYAQLGQAYIQLGQSEAAQPHLQAALQQLIELEAQTPDDDQLRQKIAWVRETLRRVETREQTMPSGH